MSPLARVSAFAVDDGVELGSGDALFRDASRWPTPRPAPGTRVSVFALRCVKLGLDLTAFIPLSPTSSERVRFRPRTRGSPVPSVG